MILNFDEIKKEDILTAGGKGANLGEMTAAKINVPTGFVITAEAYRTFLKENGIEEIITSRLAEAQNDETMLLGMANDFREMIRAGKFPAAVEAAIRKKYLKLGEHARVAVRSSATAEDLPDASFAGQQETYLNVRGVEDVLNQVRECYASLWGNRAVSYRYHQGYDQSAVSIAVVIQEMVESEKAGVLFTVNPVSKKENEMLINASYGLGESVVSGRVTADSYITDKNGNILQTNIGSKATQIIYADKNTIEVAVNDEQRKAPALNHQEILGLVKAALEIEKHYARPMDIEWAIQKGEIYILQARAITTLKNDANEEEIIQAYIKGTKLKGSMRENISFLLEKMPFAYRALDFNFIIAINDQKGKIFAEGGIVFNSNTKIDEDGIQTLPDDGKHINKNIVHIFKVLKTMKDFEYCADMCKTFMDQYEGQLKKVKKLNFQEMDLLECKEFMVYSYKLTEKLAYDRFKYALFPTMLVFDKYSKIIKKVDQNYSAFDFYWGLNNKTSAVNNDILKMSEQIKENQRLRAGIISGESFESLYSKFEDFRGLADAFIKANGFKSDYNCYCLEAKTFIEDPDRLINILRPILSADESTESNEKAKDFKALMGDLKNVYGKKYRAMDKNIAHFRYFHMVREESQYLWETLFYYVRQCVKRINILFLGNEDYKNGIANLFYEELLEAMDRGFLNDSDKEKIKRRDEKFPLAMKVWDASKLLVFESKGDILKGVSGSPGLALGKVCLIHSPKEFYKMQKGDVLVCHFTDPEWTPLFKLASAVVADTGAALSHAAIVAREFNIPAVLGVGFATTKFKDGDMIQVDGDRGLVKEC